MSRLSQTWFLEPLSLGYPDVMEFIIDEIHEIFAILDALECITEDDKNNILTHLAKDFWKKGRNDGTPYINHLKNTLLGVVRQYNHHPTRIATIVALLHDSIEDTREKFEKIKEKYGEEIALCVEFLSKESIWKFIWRDIENWEDGALEEHNLLRELFYKLEWRWVEHEYIILDEELTQEEREIYNRLKQRYKKIREEVYFSKFKARVVVKNTLRENAQKRNIELSDEKLEKLTDVIISVKLSDRSHNLATLTKNHRKKIEETIKHMRNLIIEVIHTPLWIDISTTLSWLQYKYEK